MDCGRLGDPGTVLCCRCQLRSANPWLRGADQLISPSTAVGADAVANVAAGRVSKRRRA